MSLASTLTVLALVSGQLEAQPRVPLSENFRLETLGPSAMIGAAGLGLALFETRIDAARGSPWLGGPWLFDAAVSDALYGGPGSGRLLGGVPDAVGLWGAPLAVFGAYGVDAILTWSRGTGFTGNRNADHELFALAEGYALAFGLNRVGKVMGRERPAYALHRDPSFQEGERYQSFYSGHASSTFCLASFVYRDLSDWLTFEVLEDPAEQLWLGRVLPALVLYGAASVVATSRIIDQQHYLFDVLLGAAVGTVAGHFFYALHFDAEGRARRGPVPQLVPVVFAGTANSGHGLGLGVRGVF